MRITRAEAETWTREKLRRKREQAWEAAGCARQDHDPEDEQRHLDDAALLTLLLRENAQ